MVIHLTSSTNNIRYMNSIMVENHFNLNSLSQKIDDLSFCWSRMCSFMFLPVFFKNVVVDVGDVVAIGWLANTTCSCTSLLHKLAVCGALSLFRPSRALFGIILAQVILHLALLTGFSTMYMHEANVLVALALTSPGLACWITIHTHRSAANAMQSTHEPY